MDVASACRSCLTKDQLIIAQGQIIDDLKATIQRLTTAQSTSHGQQFVATTSTLPLVSQAADGTFQFPTVSLEELAAFGDVQAVQFVAAPGVAAEPLQNVFNSATVQQPTANGNGALQRNVSQTRVVRGGRAGSSKLPTIAPRNGRKRTIHEAEVVDALMNIPVEEMDAADGGFSNDGSPEPVQTPNTERQAVTTSQAGQKTTHVLVLGSPHTRKIPLRCPLPDCSHAEYRAWDRDLLLKHFKKYHADSHPNPSFNYLCSVDGCSYISYNEPSYALYTHIKNVHREYLAQLEQNVADGIPVVERDLHTFAIEKLPSEISRTPVPIMGTISMSHGGLKCPLAVCHAGTAVFKYSSIKKLVEHFERLHSFTHPNPIFIFCCPVAGCKYSSDVGNFRVYKHMKAEHPEIAGPTPSKRTASKPESAAVVADASDADGTVASAVDNSAYSGLPDPEEPGVSSVTAASSGAVDKTLVAPSQETQISMRGSHNMVLDPLTCPLDDCPKIGFSATSTTTLRRHFKRIHRSTHPNPVFIFSCPVEGCNFVANKEEQAHGMNIWRHTKRMHPEVQVGGEARLSVGVNSVVDPDQIADGGDVEACGSTASDPASQQIRLEAVTDVLNPGTLVRPSQLRCLHPGCKRPPFSGTDKTQLLRHYAHFHSSIDRNQNINLMCPFKDCHFSCTWPAQPLYFHVETCHAVPAGSSNSSVNNLLMRSPQKDALAQSTGNEKTPIRIVGRPYAAGEFWCPVPGCGFSDNVLLHLRNHVIQKHQLTHPNPAFIFVCPLQGCSFAKQSNYQALCTHMQREHGMKRERPKEPEVKIDKRKPYEGKPKRKKRQTRVQLSLSESSSVVEAAKPQKKVTKAPVKAKTVAKSPVKGAAKPSKAPVISRAAMRKNFPRKVKVTPKSAATVDSDEDTE